MAKKSKSHPGVTPLGGGRYRIRKQKLRCPKTGEEKEIDRIVDAESAEDAAAQRLAEIRKFKEGVEAAKGNGQIRLKDCGLTWIEKKRLELKVTTVTNYESVFRNHIEPLLGNIFASKLTQADVQKWLIAQANLGNPVTVKDRAKRANTANARFDILCALLSDIQQEHGIQSAARYVKKVVIDEAQIVEEDAGKVIDCAELDALREHFKRKNPRWYALASTLAFTGLRYGELAALKWSDIKTAPDGNRYIVIRRRYSMGNLGTPKGKKLRVVGVAPELWAILDAHRERLMRAQNPGLAAGLVFPGEAPEGYGRMVAQGGFASAIMRARTALDVEAKVSPHWFRHTFNDTLRVLGTDKETQMKILGHVTERDSARYTAVKVSQVVNASNAAVSHLTAAK